MSPNGVQRPPAPQAPSEEEQSPLERFGRDLTEMAEQGKLDPVIGRDEEIRRVIQVLVAAHEEQPRADRRAGRRQDGDRRGPRAADRLRRRARVAARPPRDRARHGRADRGRHLPRRVRGPPEGRARRRSPRRRARSSCSSTSCTRSSAPARPQGSVDAANLLKPMLARGELRAVGATTLDEYRKYIEKDAALERRFQPVMVGEPSVRGHDRDPARPEGALRGPPRRAHPGQRADRRRDALAPLHRRPLPARQGDRPDRRGGLEDPHRDRLAADRDRRGRPPRDAARDRAHLAAQGEGRGLQGAPRGDRARARRAEGALGRDEGAVAEGEAGDPGHPRDEGAPGGGQRRGRTRRARSRPAARRRAALRRDPRARKEARRARIGRARASDGEPARCSSRRRSTPTTSPRSSRAGPASPSAACSRAKPRS